MMKKQTIRPTLALLSLGALLSFEGIFAVSNTTAAAPQALSACGTGQYEALLTGWALNDATPTGTARYSAKDKRLEIEVQKVKLKDGTVLDVLVGDDKVGKMEPLKDNSAKAVITVDDELDEKSRVRVFNDEVPILSANLACDADAVTSPTVSQ